MSKGTVAIIGHREAPKEVRAFVMILATLLVSRGYKIATGASGDVDFAAMAGARDQNVIAYLPWETFNSTQLREFPGAQKIVYDPRRHEEWTRSVEKYHPDPQKVTKAGFKFLARDYGIVEGKQLVIAFPRYPGSGGTGQGIRIARALGIQVIECPLKRGDWTAEGVVEEVFEKLGDKEAVAEWKEINARSSAVREDR